MQHEKDLNKSFTFLAALLRARESQERKYECPLCGGVVHRTTENNGHEHAKCNTCLFSYSQ